MFTKQERLLLICLGLIVLLGSSFHLIFKTFPKILNLVNFVDSDKSYPKVNLNTASAEELIAVPYIGQYTAENIIRYRQEYGPFKSVAEVKSVKGIRDKNYEKFSFYLKI